MAHHKLKTWPEYFEAVKSGEKPFEIRYDDRAYKVGDTLELEEWVPDAVSGDPDCPVVTGHYTGDRVIKRVTYVFRGGILGIETGYVVMGLDHPEEF